MENQLLKDFIRDIRVESVKIQFQLCTPHTKIQYNPVLSVYFDYRSLDAAIIIGILSKELQYVQGLLTVDNYIQLLFNRYNYWKCVKLQIQNNGYGSDPNNISQAYSYVFLTRLLRKHNKELYKIIKDEHPAIK